MRKIALLLVLSFPLFAQTPAGIWGERGISRRFIVRGDLVYAADGRGVSVYDVSNPAAIARIDVESGDPETRDLAFFGNSELVVATGTGIDRFAIAADGTLNRLPTVEISGGVHHIAATDNRVAAAGEQTLLILERSATRLTVIAQQAFSQTIRAVAMSGGTAYAAVKRTSIFAVDTATGETVRTIPVDAVGLAISGSTLWAVAEQRGLFAIDLGTGSIVANHRQDDVILAGVAAAGSQVYAFEGPDRIHVFDGSKPSEPALLGVMTEWVNVIAASGSRLFVAGAITDSEKRTFETGAPLRVFDVADVNAPALLGELRDLAGPVSGVWSDGSIAYVIDAPYLRVIDISTTAQPREIRSIVVPDIQDWIRARNGLAINYGRLRVHLIDLSAPRRPKVIGSWDNQGHAPSFAALSRDTFVEVNDHSGMHVVDYSNPAQPVQISGRIFHYHDVAAGDDAIYTLQQNTFLTADITDRNRVVDRTFHNAQFAQLDTLPPNSGNPHHVALRASIGITLYSLVPDRFVPRLVGFIPFEDTEMLATNDTSVFVTRRGLVYRMDVASPTGFLATDMRVTSPMQISVAGGKFVVADRYRLRVYGPDTPPPPAERGRRRAVKH